MDSCNLEEQKLALGVLLAESLESGEEQRPLVAMDGIVRKEPFIDAHVLGGPVEGIIGLSNRTGLDAVGRIDPFNFSKEHGWSHIWYLGRGGGSTEKYIGKSDRTC